MYKLGQKVIIDTIAPAIGYIVKMEINPHEETDVVYESKGWIIYTIRVYRPFYRNGYADFLRTEGEFKNADD